ncbi:hypothetical protein AWC38_SpisGene3473 [Stylophora pistillata]|uniref:Uncharacterized protein n=1 Tax=Stylophora pistillata TaxID=50429 RepID=A0A2B4SRH4_STYPI|nr:hypothetical protein AWC38_SpisGene3473 [Stylophora pistillata]
MQANSINVAVLRTESNREKAEQSQNPNGTLTGHADNERDLLEASQATTTLSENGSSLNSALRLKELTNQMTSVGNRLQAQLVSLHETVCKETETSQGDSTDLNLFSPELVNKLQGSRSDLNAEVKVLESYLGEVHQLLTLQEKQNNGVNGLNGVSSCREKNQTENLSLKQLEAKLAEISEKQEAIYEERSRQDMDSLKINGNKDDNEKFGGQGNDGIPRLDKLELDFQNFKKQLKIIQDKLYERGLLDDELAALTNIQSILGVKYEDFSASDELAILQKERKVLLTTLSKLQSRENSDSKEHIDINTCDKAVQCKINILGQLSNQGASFSSEFEELKKLSGELQAEVDELEEENKTMEEETFKLKEEKRVLEDSVNKLRVQITDALDSSFEEMEHIHHEKDELQVRLQFIEADNKKLRDAFAELSKKNADHLEAVLDEIERKDSLEDAVDYLSTEVEKLNEINIQAVYSTSEACPPRGKTEKCHNYSLLSEMKTCKELIDSQREQIRQLQVDKRDIEDIYTNLKREALILRTKQGEKTSLRLKSIENLAASMQPTRKTSVERCEYLKQEILRLTKRGTELENSMRTLKSDNSNLEEEKVCLLDSLLHQLEKNESLQVQIDQLKSTIKQNNGDKEPGKPSTNLPHHNKLSTTTHDRDTDVNGNLSGCENHALLQTSEDIAHENGTDTKDAMDESRRRSRQLDEQLQSLQEHVLGVEKEKERIQIDLEDTRKNENELREKVAHLKNECTVLKNQLKKNKEVSDTLQGCLQEAHEEKEELVESLDEVSEEKAALEKKIEIMEKEFNELKESYQRLKNEFDSVSVGAQNLDKSKGQMRSIHAKLFELYESLTDKEKDSASEEVSTGAPESTSLDEQGNSILSLAEKVLKEVNLLKKELRRMKIEQEYFKTKLDTSQTEKLSLQKYVRELDEKRRQVKSFITKLTEEKEVMSEQMEEIKQQKNNLADALENVYQSKESLQCQLEDALCKQHESSKSVTEASAEAQSLKSSLNKVAGERDALKDALIETKKELQMVRTSEAKWKEKATGSQAEADQSVQETSDAGNKVDESEVINRLHLENDGLKKQLEMLKTTQLPSQEEFSEGSPIVTSDIPETLAEPELTTASEYESSSDVYEMVTSFGMGSFEESSNDSTEVPISGEANSWLESGPRDEEEELEVRFSKVCAENKSLEAQLRRSTEENEQLKSWFESISAEKEIMEKEQESMSKENGELLRDLERMKRSFDEVSNQNNVKDKPEEDFKTALEEMAKECAKLREDLQKQEDERQELTQALQLTNMRKKALENEATESWERAQALEKSLKSVKQKNDSLSKDISALKKEKEEKIKSLEKLAQDYKRLQQNLNGLNEKLINVEKEKGEKNGEVVRLAKEVELLQEQLREKSHTLTEVENKLGNTVTENEDVRAQVQKTKSEIEVQEHKHEQLVKDYKALEENQARVQTEMIEENEKLKQREKELEGAVEELYDELNNLKSSLEDAEDKLGTTKEGVDLVEEEKDRFKSQVGNLTKQVEKMRDDKGSLKRKTEETENENSTAREQLKELENQASELLSFIDRTVKKNPTKMSHKAAQEDINHFRYVCDYIEAILKEKFVSETKLKEEMTKLEIAERTLQELRNELKTTSERLEKAENSNREIEEDNKQLIQERAELTLQLEEALEGDQTEEQSTKSKRSAREEVRLSREIDDVRSLIDKLTLQKEKLGAALANKEKQIAAVTAEATEKTKMLEHKEKEAESLSLTKAEVAVALEMAKDGSEKLLAELERERSRVESLRQELENEKKQHHHNQQEKLDLTAIVSRLEEEKKTFAITENTCRDLEKRLKKAEENNLKIQALNSELRANMESQSATLASVKKEAKDKEYDWNNELAQKDELLRSLNQDIKKSNISFSELLRVVDEQKTKIGNLDKECKQSERSRKEVVEERNVLQKKLKEEADANDALTIKLQETERAVFKHGEENEELQKRIAASDSEKQLLQRKLTDLKEQIDNREKRLADLSKSTQSLEDERAHSKTEIAALQKELTEKTLSLEKAHKELSDSRGSIDKGKSKSDELKVENVELKKLLESAESKLRRAELTSTKTKEQNDKLKRKLEAIEEEMAALNTAFAEAQRKEQTLLIEMKTETERIESELETLTSESEILREKLDDAADEKNELEQELELERGNKKKTEDQLIKMSNELDNLKVSAQTVAQDNEDLKRILENKEKELTCKKYVSFDETDARSLGISEEIISCAQEGELSSAVEENFSLESAPHDQDTFEGKLAKQRQLNADLYEELDELNDEKDELNEIIEELRSKTKKLQRDMDALIEEKENLEDKLDENAKRYKEELGSLTDGNKELSRKLEVLLKDKNILREEIKTKEQKNRRAVEDGKKLEDALEKSTQEVKRLTLEVNRLSKEIDTEVPNGLKEELAESDERMKELEYKLDQLSLEHQALMTELAERKNENATLRLAVEEATLAKEGCEKKFGDAEKELHDELDEVQQELDSKKTMIATLEEQLFKFKQSESEPKQDLKKTSDATSVKDIQRKLGESNEELKEKNKMISTLKDEINDLKRSKQQLERERKQTTKQEEPKQNLKKTSDETSIRDIQRKLRESNEELKEKNKMISTLKNEVNDLKRSKQQLERERKQTTADKTTLTDLQNKLEQLQRELPEKNKTITTLNKEIAGLKRSSREQEREMQDKFEELKREMVKKDQQITSLTVNANQKQTNRDRNDGNEEITPEKSERGDEVTRLKNELAEKEKKIGFLEEAIVEHKRTIFEQEREFDEKEASLATAREEFYKSLKEKCEDEERLESLRRANNRLQEALNIAREKESKLKKELQGAKVRGFTPSVQREISALDGEFSEVHFEVETLRKLSYDERAEKNYLRKTSLELKRSPSDMKDIDSKELDKVKELRKEKDRLSSENEKLKKTARDLTVELEKINKEMIFKETENSKQRNSELSFSNEAVERKNKAIESELDDTKYSLNLLEKQHGDLKDKFRKLEENRTNLDNERIKLVDDAHSFKIKMEKKNQDLLSKLEAKEHEAISQQERVEGLSALLRKFENNVRSLEKDKESLASQVRLLEYDKEQIEEMNKQQKAEIVKLLESGSQKDFNTKLRTLFSENDRLEGMNKKLQADLRELYREVDRKDEERKKLIEELHEMALKVKQLEKEKQNEASIKEQLAEQLMEKDNAMKTKTKLLSTRLDGLLKETENLKDSSGKMEQMASDYRRLEDENVQLIEGTEKLREEIASLQKENDLLRRACQQLRGRKSIAEDKFVLDGSNTDLSSDPYPRKGSLNKPLVHKFQPIEERVSAEQKSELNTMSGRDIQEPRRRSYDPVPSDIKISKGSLAPMPPWTGEAKGRQSQRDQERSNSTPVVKRFPPGAPEARREAAQHPKGPPPPSTDSSRSSDTERSFCSRSSYCSPILSVVDMCPLHRNPSVERPPNQCPICKKERRRPGAVPKEFMTLEKYV